MKPSPTIRSPYRTRCDDCGALPGARCRYLDNRDNRRIGRVGKLTLRPHTIRLNDALLQDFANQAVSRSAELGRWLRQHGDIFKEQ